MANLTVNSIKCENRNLNTKDKSEEKSIPLLTFRREAGDSESDQQR